MDTAPGFYGKFPELGDFVNRRLPKGFLDPWDEWLQNAIATSRQQLGSDWLNLYLTSPVWSFVLSKGLCGEYPWHGVIMPSVDRVGRYFPLTLACRLPLDANPIQVAARGSGWFDMAEQIIVSALDEKAFDMEEFDAKVVSLGTLDELSGDSGAGTDMGFGSAWQIPMNTRDVNAVLPTLMHQLVLQRLGDYSLWWGSGSDRVSPSVLLCAGMPQVTDFAAMLSGDWSSGSWEQWPIKGPQSEGINIGR